MVERYILIKIKVNRLLPDTLYSTQITRDNRFILTFLYYYCPRSISTSMVNSNRGVSGLVKVRGLL